MKILLQQNTIAHYRRRLYEQLHALEQHEYLFVADLESDTPFMETADDTWAARLGVHKATTRVFHLGKLTFSLQLGALQVMQRERPDAVIALGSPYSLTAWILVLLGRLQGTPVVLWTHGLLDDRESGAKWWLRSLLFRLSSGLLLYGDRAAQLLQQRGWSEGRTPVVYNSLDADRQESARLEASKLSVSEVRRQFELDDADRVIIFTGRLQPLKRLDLLVRAISKLRAATFQVSALLIGEGTERQSLSRLAKELNVSEYIRLPGPSHSEPELAKAFQASDLCVIPSGAGLSVMHALAYGTPVVTHRDFRHQFPEVEALVEGQTGFFFPKDDCDGLVDTLKRGLYPVSAKSALSENCLRVIAERYNPTQHAERLTEGVLKLASCKTS